MLNSNLVSEVRKQLNTGTPSNLEGTVGASQNQLTLRICIHPSKKFTQEGDVLMSFVLYVAQVAIPRT